jgi:hypothetical protein
MMAVNDGEKWRKYRPATRREMVRDTVPFRKLLTQAISAPLNCH